MNNLELLLNESEKFAENLIAKKAIKKITAKNHVVEQQ